MKTKANDLTLTTYRYILIATANVLLLLVGVCAVLADFAEFVGIVAKATRRLYYYLRAKGKYLVYEYGPIIKYIWTEAIKFRDEICAENRAGEYA